ncbi:rho GTPase-activating protein 26 isoform X3 [Photinus pyralis]|uniref:Rho GTPase-activating protein 26 n=1 Tax=Photinus pyralis TaxID=7054 RepID=A0A1Y1LRG4_PHOPY|nr:rho GTPase-activating protein 26 isoform X3 [Photinus pyralis]
MGVGLPPLEFTECMSDSPYFRENLHQHEKELDNTSQQIKRLIKEVKDLLTAARQLSQAQRSFSKNLQGFTFECIGGIQTDDEQVISRSLNEFGKLISSIEDERDRMLDAAFAQVVQPLEHFRKKQIGDVKTGKKKFDKQTTKFCQSQERYLNLAAKKQETVLQEADASLGMAERHFYLASMEYVCLIQEVHERKKFEFVEILLSFMFGWLTFYHQGHEVAKDFRPYMEDLQYKIQKTRSNFEENSKKLRNRMHEMQKQTLDEPIRNLKGHKEGYLYLLEKKAFGTTWTKHYCTYNKETKEFTMLPFNQLTTKNLQAPEIMVLSSCVRRMSDSIEKRFCFDLQVDSRPGVTYTFQALSEVDRKSWLDVMDGKEPTYTASNNIKPQNSEERILDEVGIQFVKRCIETLENRGLEDQGIYRVVGVTSKVTKLLSMGLDRRKTDKSLNLEDPLEWETKTLTSALKSYLRNLPEPLMTHRYHNGFIAAVKNDSRQMRVRDVHTLIHRLPKANFEVLKLLIKHLTNVVSKSEINLMTISNLGVCFGPTLLRPEEETVASIMDLKFYNIVVEILIENFEKIFNTEPEREVDTTSSQTSGYNSTLSSANNISDTSATGHLSPAGHVSPVNYINSDNHPSQFINNVRNYNHVRHNVNYNTQPLTCTIRKYYETPPGTNLSSSLYNVHEPTNGGTSYSMTRSDHTSPGTGQHLPQHRLIQRYATAGVSSQSESNIPNLRSFSPTSFKLYEPNSTSSSNESVSSLTRDGTYIGNHISPEKNKRSNIGLPYPKSYRAQGNIRVRTLYACLGENDGELSFEPNQIITNVKASQEPGWLEGTLNGKTGLIPENYVEMLP